MSAAAAASASAQEPTVYEEFCLAVSNIVDWLETAQQDEVINIVFGNWRGFMAPQICLGLLEEHMDKAKALRQTLAMAIQQPNPGLYLKLYLEGHPMCAPFLKFVEVSWDDVGVADVHELLSNLVTMIDCFEAGD